MARTYMNHDIRWHFRNGTYKEIKSILVSSKNSKLLGKLYRRQDGRYFSVFFSKDIYPHPNNKRSYVHEVLPHELEDVCNLFETFREK